MEGTRQGHTARKGRVRISAQASSLQGLHRKAPFACDHAFKAGMREAPVWGSREAGGFWAQRRDLEQKGQRGRLVLTGWRGPPWPRDPLCFWVHQLLWCSWRRLSGACPAMQCGAVSQPVPRSWGPWRRQERGEPWYQAPEKLGGARGGGAPCMERGGGGEARDRPAQEQKRVLLVLGTADSRRAVPQLCCS